MRERKRSAAQGGVKKKERPPPTLPPSFSFSLYPLKNHLHSQGTLTMTSAQRKASPASSAAATRHNASTSLGSQSRAAIVAASDQRACILDVFVVAFAVALDRGASGFAPPARARRVEAAIRGWNGCTGRHVSS